MKEKSVSKSINKDSAHLSDLIVKRLKKVEPYKIILFGSYAQGTPSNQSDIDLIVVLDKENIPQNFEEHIDNKLMVRNALWDINTQIPMDILVYTKKMYQKFIELGSLFSKEIQKKGEVLYEKNNPEWLKAAQDDLRVIEEIVNNENLTHAVAFHSQQAIEKTFKGIIEEKELEFVKTHDLIRLYEIVKNHLNTEWELYLLKKINAIYVDSRYPGELGLLPYGKPTREDARKYYQFAKKVVEETKRNLL